MQKLILWEAINNRNSSALQLADSRITKFAPGSPSHHRQGQLRATGQQLLLLTRTARTLYCIPDFPELLELVQASPHGCKLDSKAESTQIECKRDDRKGHSDTDLNILLVGQLFR